MTQLRASNLLTLLLLATSSLAAPGLARAQEESDALAEQAGAPAEAAPSDDVAPEPAAEPEPALDEAPPSPAPAEAPAAEPMLLVHVSGGVFLPQAFNRLDTSFIVQLGAGYVLPFLDHRLAIVIDGFYTRPERTEEISDPRLGAGSYRYTLVQNDLSLFLGVYGHFTHLTRDMFVPYAALGVRVHFLWSEIDGMSGDGTLGAHRETSTQVGGALRVGLGIRLGPGLLFAEAEGQLAPIEHLVTGSANMGDISIALGYRLVL